MVGVPGCRPDKSTDLVELAALVGLAVTDHRPPEPSMRIQRDCPPLKHNGGMAEAGWHELRVAVHGRPVFVRRGPEIPGSIPLVHVHGFAVSGRYLLPTARALAHRATTVVPDLPGYGKAPPGVMPWGSDRWPGRCARSSTRWVWNGWSWSATPWAHRCVWRLRTAHPSAWPGLCSPHPRAGCTTSPWPGPSCSSRVMWGGKARAWHRSCCATTCTSAR